MENNTQQEIIQEEALSDDELYAKIQTEKLLKRKKTRKISTLIGVCFAFVLAVVIIVLGAVPVSLKPRCIDDNFYAVHMVAGTTTSQNQSFTKGEDGFNDFKKILNKSFSQPCLASIFSGSLMEYDIDETKTSASTIVGSSGELIANGTYYVRLQYLEPQTLTKQNGKKYVSRYSNQYWENLTFTNAYIVVNKEAGFQETKIYVVVTYPEFNSQGEQTGSSEEKVVTITVKANTYQIYKAWEELLEY